MQAKKISIAIIIGLLLLAIAVGVLYLMTKNGSGSLDNNGVVQKAEIIEPENIDLKEAERVLKEMEEINREMEKMDELIAEEEKEMEKMSDPIEINQDSVDAPAVDVNNSIEGGFLEYDETNRDSEVTEPVESSE